MGPEVRGRYMSTFVQHVDALAERAKIRDAIGEERMKRIERSTSFFDWLPVEENLVATRAVADAIGARRTHDFFVALQYAELATPLFSWVRMLTPTLDKRPERTLGWIAKGYSMMFRNAGTWRVIEVEKSTATLEMLDVPEAMTSDGVWIASVGSSLHAVYRVSNVDGAVTLAETKPRPRFRFRWS
jgi:hypothetical protein